MALYVGCELFALDIVGGSRGEKNYLCGRKLFFLLQDHDSHWRPIP